MGNTEQEPKKRSKMSRKAMALITAGAVVGGLYVANKLGIIDAQFYSRTDVERPEVTVNKIKPIDIGCFVEVDSTVRLKAHERRIAGIGIAGINVAHQSLWTNTTRAEYEGEGRLCVDNTDTEISLVKDKDTGVKTVNVDIGRLYTEGFINHNGHDGPKTNPAFGERLGDLFVGGDNSNVNAGLNLIAQTMLEQTPCVKEAIPVAKSSIKSHYANLVNNISEGAIKNVNVEFSEVPGVQNFPLGKINHELRAAGLEIPKSWSVISESPFCSVVEVGGQPAVASSNHDAFAVSKN